MSILEELQRELGIPKLLSRILLSRGIDSLEKAQNFLFPKLENLSDPFSLPDIEKALFITIRAIREKKKICLFADYDADGITSCALLLEFLRNLGIDPCFYIPTRMEGYGLSESAVRKLREEGVDLIIGLDLGSTNYNEIELAKSLGMEVVVLDHHEVQGELPKADAIVNPKRKDSRFPTRELAACGVCFFFLIALRRELSRRGLLNREVNLKRMMDIVALGTIADQVPLVDDNRILVKFGIENMRRRPRTWLKSLLKKGVISQEKLDENTLSFIVGPRINAPGRVSDPTLSLRFLVEDDEEKSISLLIGLNEANQKRQAIEEGIIAEISEILRTEDLVERRALIFHNESWHVGVLGIVAQRVVETVRKPTFVLTTVNGVLRGSARGVEGMDLYGLISSHSRHLLKFGGHKYACGISLLRENLKRFSEEVESTLSSYTFKSTDSSYDVEADFDELDRVNVESLNLLSPFGTGNPRPRILLYPAQVIESLGRLKIIDGRRRVWYGSLKGQTYSLDDKVHGLIVTPELREELGETFVHLFVKGIISKEE